MKKKTIYIVAVRFNQYKSEPIQMYEFSNKRNATSFMNKIRKSIPNAECIIGKGVN